MKKIVMMLLALGAASFAADARKVSGSVISGEEKLAGVIVTDGENFTQTKKNGKFSFEINDDAEFVYIVTPSGYVADWSTGVLEAAGTGNVPWCCLCARCTDWGRWWCWHCPRRF